MTPAVSRVLPALAFPVSSRLITPCKQSMQVQSEMELSAIAVKKGAVDVSLDEDAQVSLDELKDQHVVSVTARACVRPRVRASARACVCARTVLAALRLP
jgi:hypothetical protein